MENILQIADLTKRYPDFYLDHLTLNVPSGSIVGLIGENGAGKTTTMNLILNAVTKDSGNILVFGQDNLSHEKEVKQRIGVVQDECNLPFMFSPADIETIMRQIYAQWDTDRYCRAVAITARSSHCTTISRAQRNCAFRMYRYIFFVIAIIGLVRIRFYYHRRSPYSAMGLYNEDAKT